MGWIQHLQAQHPDLTELEELSEITMKDCDHYLELKGKYKGEPCLIGLKKDYDLSFIYDVIDVNVYVKGKIVKQYSDWA